ncbi:MAG: hypothetical protein WBE13_13850 [Candidatus Acidiferrum sp.]
MFTTVLGGASPAQFEKASHIVFENEDFAVLPLGDLHDPHLENRSFSGLLVFRGHSGPVESTTDVWKFSGPQWGSRRYYWADSAKADRLTAFTGGENAFLVVSKSRERLNRKLFAPDLPDAFEESVGYDIQSIADLVAVSEYGKSPSKTEQNRARAGLEDLSFKSNWFSSSGGGVASPSPLVGVTARTIGRSGTVVQHCTVWYVPLAWEDDKQHWKRFDQFSSPTSQSIPVGQYKMWANHNGQDGTKSTVNPGDDYKPTKNIDLDVL